LDYIVIEFHFMHYVIVHSPSKFKQPITKIKYGGNCNGGALGSGLQQCMIVWLHA